MKKIRSLIKAKSSKISVKKIDLLEDLRNMIDQAKRSVALVVNTHLTALNWKIGRRIHTEILKEKRADYGKEILATLSRELTKEYGTGFKEASLWRMVQFAELFPDEQIVATLSRELSWSHFVDLFPIKDSLKRDFYAEMCRIEKWNVRTLRKKIDSMLYERTAISKKPELLVKAELEMLRKEDQLTPDLVFRDPYVLEFLNLNDRYVEKDVEDAIMRELEQFLLELGVGFTFVERQKRIIVDGEDFHLDLRLLEKAEVIPASDESVDAVVMSTVLCCITDEQKLVELMAEIRRVLKKQGVLYITDFLICEHPRYQEKYSSGLLQFGEWGIYTTNENLTVRHFTTQLIMQLLRAFDIQWFEQFDFKTMNQNPARTFHCIAKKIV